MNDVTKELLEVVFYGVVLILIIIYVFPLTQIDTSSKISKFEKFCPDYIINHNTIDAKYFCIDNNIAKEFVCNAKSDDCYWVGGIKE